MSKQLILSWSCFVLCFWLETPFVLSCYLSPMFGIPFFLSFFFSSIHSFIYLLTRLFSAKSQVTKLGLMKPNRFLRTRIHLAFQCTTQETISISLITSSMDFLLGFSFFVRLALLLIDLFSLLLLVLCIMQTKTEKKASSGNGGLHP